MELLFVDDGSRDETLEIVQDMASKDSRIKYISFSRNFGKEAAIYVGLEQSSGNLVAIVNVDLQDQPTLLLEMYKEIVENK